MKRLIIADDDYQKIVKYCLKGRPFEVCGIMGGTKNETSDVVEKVYYMENIQASKESYLMKPEEQFEVFRDMRQNNLELISIFHSHPETPARPSAEDIRKAYYSNVAYTIISLQNKEPVVKAFIIKNDNYREIKIIKKQ